MNPRLQKLVGRARRFLRRFNITERRLKKLHEIFLFSTRGEHVVSLNGARKIFHIVQDAGVKNALDLGTGIGASAAFIAAALPQEGRVWSVEQDPSFAEEAKRLIPPELLKKVSISISAPYAFITPRAPHTTIAGYRTLPIEHAPFDFVLIDGPAGWSENGAFLKYPNGDLFNLLPYLARRCVIFIDNRESTVELYKKTLGRFLTHTARWRNYCIFVYQKPTS